MSTVSIIGVCTFMSIGLNPIGIAMSNSDRARADNLLLDVMQTMPSFVYLIPVVMFLELENPWFISSNYLCNPPIIN